MRVMRAIGWWGGVSPRRRIFLAVLAVAVVAVVAGAVVGVVGSLGGGPGVTRADENRPGDVLLVPGYGGSTTALDGLAAKISAVGRTATVVHLAGNGTGDLRVQADVLNGYVNKALSAGSGPVTIIGYSAGGVVAWLWDEQYHGVAKAREIITLGSPLHGADLAGLGAAFVPSECPTACQQLVPGSAMLTGLQQTAVATRPPWLSLWTTDDQVVKPPTSARLPGAVNVPLQSICPDVSIQHGQLPTAPLAVGIVLRALRASSLTAPAPSECHSLVALGGGTG